MRIVVKQVSGLGNQMFQYAAGCYYAKRYNAELSMAIDPPHAAMSHGSFPRPFLLSNFSPSAPLKPLTQRDKLVLSKRRSLQAITGPLKRALGLEICTELVAQRYHFLPSLSLRPGTKTAYLVGYWQSYRMVDEVAEVLHSEFAFSRPAQGANLAMMQEIEAAPNATSLHIRRGDYTLAAEGNIALPISYYRKAMALLEDRLENPTYFVFSDDIAFAKQHLPAGGRKVFVEHNDDYSSHEDLRLMSACRHHIIANSSFSWWGAWLNRHPDKQVIAPRHWHLTANSYHPELFPPEWTLLDSIRED